MSVLLKPYARLDHGRATSRFYLADCLDVFEQLQPGSVDVIVTSPPYNLGIGYSQYQDTLSADEYLAWTDRWIAAATRVLRPDGSLFLNVGAKPSDPWTALDVAQRGRSHLRLQNIIHWVKSIAIDRKSTGTAAGLDRDLAIGHYKPINSTRFLNDCHEFVFHFTPGGATTLDRLALGVPYQDQSNIGRWRGAADGVRCRGNTWFIPYDTVQSKAEKFHHPSTFPLLLPRWCIQLHGVRQPVVLDPFMGSGTTVLAAALEAGHGIGIEMDPSYFEIARARLEAVQLELSVTNHA
jgi:site-specific DNA-methyltransferase (adenine-specific)